MSNSSNLDIWIAGAFAAVTVDFIVYPFDTLKTRIQSPNYETVYKDAATRVVRKDVLFRGLYQGVWSVVFSTIPSSGAFFTTYEALKHVLTITQSQSQSQSQCPKTQTSTSLPLRHHLPTPIIHAIASSAAEMVSCFILTPAEVIKQNAQMVNTQSTPTSTSSPSHSPGQGQTQKKPTPSTTATMQAVAKFRHRPWKLWSGYTALVGRNLPFTGLHFPIMEYVRGRLVDWRRRRRRRQVQSEGTRRNINEDEDAVVERAVLTGLAAAVSGTIASVVTTPIDVVKTRMMLSAGDNGDESSKGKRLSSWTVGRRLFQHEGIKGLFRGGAIRAVWTASALSIYLGMYEGGRFYLEKRRGESHHEEEEAAM